IKILRNVWVIGIWKLKPIDWLVAIVAGVRSHCQPYLCLGVSKFLYALDLPYNDIGPRHNRVPASRAMQGRHDHRFGLAVNKLLYLDGPHRRADGDFSNEGTSSRGPAESAGKLVRHQKPSTLDTE